MKKLAIAVALLFAGVGSAQAFPHMSSFTDAKTGYVVKVRHTGTKTYMTGRHPEKGTTFKLAVRPSGKVTGTFNGEPVAFKMTEAGDISALNVRSGTEFASLKQ